MKFHERLKELRTASGITQSELSKRSGVSYSYITKLEGGFQDNPTREILEAIGAVLEVPLSAIYDFGDLDTTVIEPTKDIVDLQQQILIDTYEQLNQTGKQKLTDYANDLVSSGRYNANDDDIRTFKVAARNGKDTIELTKEQREELIKISKEPFDIPKGTF